PDVRPPAPGRLRSNPWLTLCAVAFGLFTSMPAQLRAAVVEGSGQAFVNGMHTALVVTGVLCLVGVVLAAVGIRTDSADRSH
ncbi:MAG: MFS transporter, partial [Streptomyces sp.]|nr:MFS transporter [Streptomyces sp.]